MRQDASAGIGLDELSMGMSGDFESAIQEGATVVRVGQAMCGARALSGSFYCPTAHQQTTQPEAVFGSKLVKVPTAQRM